MPSLLFSAHICPPWASIMLFEIKSPSPVPDWDFIAIFENSLGIISGCIAVPVSFTLTIIITNKRRVSTSISKRRYETKKIVTNAQVYMIVVRSYY